jgi:hypothetical protein
MHTTTQLSFAFIGGAFFGLIVGVVAMYFWMTAADRAYLKQVGLPKHKGIRKFPRRTTRPESKPVRVPGRPTNVDQPASEIRQVQFRGRRETRE